ncbi:porphobilinogen synthase [Sinanaerobacter chloroacetimidivorans]|uniref:Delta-aminolevulinic acid dehydratase n=1 Tax=Sinanaerobacter chloroacetimidivorans TaxID=2818044 RepID=A0A8J7VYC2_9FIRM|nr:porphobilinogen synthase [Sinanaerobacter chloroacetimidivorans]MBR0597342.1 porphobilinogen synthase [Sinanaerobacter chloroacetimidivorans]
MEIGNRPRRLRMDGRTRDLVRETRIGKSSLIYPIFVEEGKGIRTEIAAMPGQKRYSPDTLAYGLEEAAKAGITNIMFFGIPEHKDECGSQAYADHGIVQQALRIAKKEFPDLYYIGDVCMCEYTSNGHCGMIKGDSVDNDKTLPLLAKTALSQVMAGADMIAPSDMMDGRVLAIRRELDAAGYIDTPIMSYAAKYASAFYGPFREAAGSGNFKGNRKTYQMDYHNRKEAMKEVWLDLEEGADIVMVKPALSYLDIIRDISDAVKVPTAAYSVSGEYTMIKMAAQTGMIDEKAMIAETAVSIFRAGADILITYFAKEIAEMIGEGRIG